MKSLSEQLNCLLEEQQAEYCQYMYSLFRYPKQQPFVYGSCVIMWHIRNYLISDPNIFCDLGMKDLLLYVLPCLYFQNFVDWESVIVNGNSGVFCEFLRILSLCLLGILMGAFIKIIEAQKLANWKVYLKQLIVNYRTISKCLK